MVRDIDAIASRDAYDKSTKCERRGGNEGMAHGEGDEDRTRGESTYVEAETQ